MGSATVLYVDGRAVVADADPVVWVSDELWQQAVDASAAADESVGAARVDDDVISFGTPGEGLGRVAYRAVRYDAERGVHVCERIG